MRSTNRRRSRKPETHPQSNEISVIVRAMSGEVAWGPQAINRAASAEVLLRRVAKSLQRPVAAVKLFHNSQEVRRGISLEEAEILDGAVLNVVITNFRLQAAHDLQQIISLAVTKGTALDCMDEQECIYQKQLPRHIKLIANACAIEAFSEEISECLELFLLNGKRISCSHSGTSSMYFTRSALWESQPGLLYLNECSDDDDWRFYMVDLNGDLSDWIDLPMLDNGRGAVWYGVMARDNGCMLNGANPSLDFWRSALSGLGFKFAENMVRVIRCVAVHLIDFYSRWNASGPPTEAIDHASGATLAPDSTTSGLRNARNAQNDNCTISKTQILPTNAWHTDAETFEMQKQVETNSMFCTTMLEYLAEGEGYLSVHVGDRLKLLFDDPQPGDEGCRWESYVFAQKESIDGDKGWIPLHVLRRRYLDADGRPWLHDPMTDMWCWGTSWHAET